LYTDGGARGNPGPAGAGAVLVDERGATLKTARRFLGETTNNEAEYMAVWLGLETLKKTFSKEKLKQLTLELRVDSELVGKQLLGRYQIKEAKLVPWFMKIWNARVADFPRFTVTCIRREANAAADRLANQAMDEGK